MTERSRAKQTRPKALGCVQEAQVENKWRACVIGQRNSCGGASAGLRAAIYVRCLCSWTLLRSLLVHLSRPCDCRGSVYLLASSGLRVTRNAAQAA